jgi:ATP-dependent DNA helicase DinG
MFPTPNEVGIVGEKFTEWRTGQIEALLAGVDSERRFVAQCMPTGYGKSPTYIGQALLTGSRTLVVTATKALQNQLMTDFAASGLIDLRGKGNYECPVITDMGVSSYRGKAEDGPCHTGMSCALKFNGGCEYFERVRQVRRGSLVVTNYSKWIAEGMAAREEDSEEHLGQFDLIIFDEAHEAVDQLASALAVKVENADLSIIGAELPNYSTIPEWVSWAKGLARKADDRIETLKTLHINATGFNNKRDMREVIYLRRLRGKLEKIARFVSGQNWIFQREPYAVAFEPVWPAPYAERLLFQGADKVMFFSATIRQKTLEMLGVPNEELEFLDYSSIFPAMRRPVWYVPTVRMHFKMSESDWRVWVAQIDNIIRPRLGRKGIVHTVSYDRSRRLLQQSHYQEHFYTHVTATTAEVLAKFRRAQPPAVLVSPSVSTGYDFPGDECRWQIIGKIAFANTQSEVIKARTASDPAYSPYLAVQELVQATGRGMRSEQDWCESFIVDNSIKYIVGKWREFLPRWWIESYRSAEIPPQPMKEPGGR